MPKAKLCGYCGKPAEGGCSIPMYRNFSGPEVPLCDKCAEEGDRVHTQIWDKFAQIEDDLMCLWGEPSDDLDNQESEEGEEATYAN